MATLDIVGTAATGAPLAGAAVSLKCVGTSRTVSADENGAYAISSVRVDAMPCLLRAQQASTVYVAPVSGAGGEAITVNATPLTHLLSSRLLGEPADRAFQNAGPSTFELVNPAGISAARGQVRSQLDRLGIEVPGLSSEWISERFEPRSGDPHDEFLEALREALQAHGLTVASAATQLASSDATLQLPPRDPKPACTPRLIDGFSGADQTRWTLEDGGAGQVRGIGIGGGPGLTRGALVEVTFADGTRLAGARTDADKGMVTLVPCSLGEGLPALVRMSGGTGASYYDAGSGRWVSFEGKSLHAVVNAFEVDTNLAVTPFTEAVYRRVLALANGDARPWQDAGRIERAHDEIKSAVNDLLPGAYRIERLDRMPLLIDDRIDIDGVRSLPRTQASMHGVAVAALARVSAENRTADPAPALEIAERLAADLEDGVLDNPYADVDFLQTPEVVPAYQLNSFWERMAIASINVGRKAGVPAMWSGRPFPLALVRPSGHRSSMVWPEQYIGLYSDGILRAAVRVHKDLAMYCGTWCDPVRKVAASVDSEWWIYELGEMVEFDPDTRTARSADGKLWSVGDFSQDQTHSPLWPLEGGQPLQPKHLPGFEIGVDGRVYRLVYPEDPQTGLPISPPSRGEELSLPTRARQLSSDGRLTYALLSNGEVYVLNPEIIVAEMGFFPIEGLPDEAARRQYWGTFRSAGHPRNIPLRVNVEYSICRIGGTYLHACDGQLLLLDRLYYWKLFDINWSNIRAPGDEYVVRPATGLDGRGWRALKAPLSVDLAWDDSTLRLLSRTDGSYVLESDTWGIWEYEARADGLPRRHRVTQQLVRAWLGG